MAAGLGFKDFTTGEVLTAADVDGYLMQGIWVFASEAARNAAVTSPQEGNFAFTKDNNSLWYYDGAAWVASGATGDIEGVTAGVGISGGGTSGTVTITNSMATAIDAKGDLVVGTGADTFSRLAVGTNGHTLVADSSTSTGLAWSAPAASSGPAFLAYRSADTAFVNGVWTKTPFNAESFDTDNCFDSTTNYRFTPNKAGYYNIQTQVRLSPNTGIWAQLRLYKNGSAVRGAIEEPSTSGKCIPISTLIYMNGSSDYLEVYYYIEGSGNLQGDSTNFPTWFDGERIRS